MNVSRQLRNIGALVLCGLLVLVAADTGRAGPLDGVTKQLPPAPSLPKVPPLRPAPSLPSAPAPAPRLPSGPSGGSAPAGGGGAPALSGAPAGGGLLPGGSGAAGSGSGSGSESGSGGSSAKGGGKGASASSERGAAKSRKQAQERRARVRRDRQLRETVTDLIGCLYAVSNSERKVLSLRAGLGAGPARSRGYVSDRLNIPSGRVARIERRGLAGLRSANGATGCGSGAFTVSTVLSSIAPLASAALDGAPQLASTGELGGGEQPAERGGVLGVDESSGDLPAVPGEASGPSSLGMLSLDESGGSSSFGALMLLLLVLAAVVAAAGLFGAHRRRALHSGAGNGGGGWSVSHPPPAALDRPRRSDQPGTSTPGKSATSTVEPATTPSAPAAPVSNGGRQSSPAGTAGPVGPGSWSNGSTKRTAPAPSADDRKAQLRAASRRVAAGAAVLTPAVASLLARRASRKRGSGRSR